MDINEVIFSIDNETSSLSIINKNDIKKYIILDYLGYGTIGRVYKIKSKETDEYFVIKVSRTNCSIDLYTEKNLIIHYFEKYKIKHKNYPICYGRFTNINSVGIMYPYLGFYNLENIKKTNYIINFENNISIIRQIIEQLITFKDIIHADIKPSNIVINNLDSNITATIIDFGLMKPKLTTKNIISTNFISSPESLFSLKKFTNSINNKSDINFSKHDYYGLYCVIINLFVKNTFWNVFSDYLYNIIKLTPLFIVKNEAVEVFTYIYYKYYDDIPNKSYLNLINRIEDYYPTLKQKNYYDYDTFFYKYIVSNLNEKSFDFTKIELFKDFINKIYNFNPNNRLSLSELLEHEFLNIK